MGINQRMGLRGLGGAALAAVLLVAGTAKAQEQDDAELIQGTWICVAALHEGEEVDNYVGVMATMTEDELIWHFPQEDGTYGDLACEYSIDPDENPKHYDWVNPNRPDDVHHRYYILTENTLIWSGDLGTEPRPENFTAGHWQFVMERVEDD